ncbi:TonB-dependent receptor [Novosphingobium colocasiae]|uniref:TonB-dependent receptor n=1 Tax=Novosphingobium colocasiae TaxID=1256513 RepID=A0A918PCE0_9SPHN|nr:TonB-dependent receptor [Novosphingobium colocasiae]GGY98983.1 hypothetical protein GCM10011614_12380 [Novosphingobium colocasiae]
MRAAWPLLLAGTVIAAAPAHAGSGHDEVRIDVPAGSAGAAAIALARQTGTSIVITDSSLARRAVPALRGRMARVEAVRRLARAAGADAIGSGTDAWRLVPRAPASLPPATPRTVYRAPEPPPETVAAEPIVVISSKRDLTLDQFPGQITVLDGDDLVRGGVGGSEKITQRLATVTSTHLGSGRNKLFIRGIADSSFTGPTQATVGQYLGDLRLSYNAPDPDLRLSDVERVEVLEGPQGALYGAGSLGGILRIVPRMPRQGVVSASGQIGGALTQDGDPGGDISATINLPISGELAALRVTADAEQQGGYIDKPAIARSDVNRTRIYGGRAIVRVEPAAGFSVDLIGLAQSTRARDSQYVDRGGHTLNSLATLREGAQADYAQGQVVVSAQWGGVRLRSSTGITGQELAERYDATMPGGPARLFEQTNRTRMVAHETRIWNHAPDGLGWLAGVSYTHNLTRLGRRFIEPDPVSGRILAQGSSAGVRNRIDELTLYGEASLPLVRGFTATLGGRYTMSWLGGAGNDVSPLLARAFAAVTANRTEKRFLPSASLLLSPRAGSVLYLRYQEGFRPGGLAIENDFVRRFNNDHTATFEAGARIGRADSGPFDLATSISYTRWDDIQADFIDGAGLPSSANIGDGRVWSASLSGGVRLSPGLRVEGGVTVNRSKIDRPSVSALLPMLAGLAYSDQLTALYTRTRQVPNIAQVSGRLGLGWTRPVTQELALDIHGWASYVGRSRLGVGPELGEAQGDYLDSGFTVRIGRADAGVTLGVTNLANRRGNRFSLGTPFSVGREQVTPLRPRTVRLGFDASF